VFCLEDLSMNARFTSLLAAVALALAAGAAVATQAPAAAPAQPQLSEHVRQDIQRHRAMAVAHDNAARCLESGRSKDECHERLRAECRGLAVGRYCGMRHQH
jgi:hypothetical protein